MKTMGSVIGNIIKILLEIILVCLAAIGIWHYFSSKSEIKKNPTPGKIVSVDNKEMSVFTAGNKGKTIVMIGGDDNTAPIIDFMPLVRKLSETNKVIVIESFGYGWSSITYEDRDLTNLTKELKEAIEALEINDSVILLAEGSSMLTAINYSLEYPDKVSSIISYDGYFPNYYKEDKQVSKLWHYMTKIGWYRFSKIYVPDERLKADVYTAEELKTGTALDNINTLNVTMLNYKNSIYSIAKDLNDKKISKNIPMILLVSSDTKKELGDKYENILSDNITNSKTQIIKYIDGNHYMHYSNFDKVIEEINKFIK